MTQPMTAEDAMDYLDQMITRMDEPLAQLDLTDQQKVGVATIVTTEVAVANPALRAGLIAAGIVEEAADNVPTNLNDLVMDLFRRCERTVKDTCELAVASGVTFTADDIFDRVEKSLPPNYPTPEVGDRRRMIRRMCTDILNGTAYEED